MSGLVFFDFEGQPVRVVEIDGEPHFVGKDVANRLGYQNPSEAMTDHCRGVPRRYPIVDSLGRRQEARVLSEADVLRLIMRSQLPAAQRFERLVFEVILPAIRRTGSYGTAKLSPRETAAALAVIRETRTLHGDAAARAIWPRLGLPPVPPPDDDAAPDLRTSEGPKPAEKKAPRDYVAAFVANHCALDPAAEISAGAFRSAYLHWAKRAGAPLIASMALGKYAVRAGVARRKSGGSIYVGIRLKGFAG